MQRDVVVVRFKNVKFHATLNSDLCQVEVQQFVGTVFPVGHVHVHQIIFIQNPMSSTCHCSHHLVDVFPSCRNRYLMEWQDPTVNEKCLGRLLQHQHDAIWSFTHSRNPVRLTRTATVRKGHGKRIQSSWF